MKTELLNSMIMKTIKYLGLLLLITLTATSCMENFLEEEVYSDLSPSNFYTTEADALAAVSAVYNNLQYFGNELWDVGTRFMVVSEATTDIMHCNWYMDSEGYTYSSTAGDFLILWNHCYNTNNKANLVFVKLPGIEMNEDLRERLIAETKFLRALNYFNAVRWWGDIPLILEAVEDFSGIADVSRDPASQVYDQIIQDLDEAIAVLPVSYADASDAGRVTRGAAKALLGKVYLTRGMGGDPATANTSDLQAAVDEFEDLMASPFTYDLAADIRDVFDYTQENTPELGHIFSQQYSQGLGYEGTWIAQNMQAMELEAAWWGYSAPEAWLQGSDGFASAWEQTGLPDDSTWYFVPYDDRLQYLFEDYNNMMWMHWCKKWQYESYQGWAEHPQNFTQIRFADVLLMHSEALNELRAAPDAEVVEGINRVRTRANVPVYDPANWTKETFRDEIQDERNRELWGECHAWFDYVRKGMLVERMKAFNPDLDFINDDYNLFPIPQQEIENNPSLTQNPGW